MISDCFQYFVLNVSRIVANWDYFIADSAEFASKAFADGDRLAWLLLLRHKSEYVLVHSHLKWILISIKETHRKCKIFHIISIYNMPLSLLKYQILHHCFLVFSSIFYFIYSIFIFMHINRLFSSVPNHAHSGHFIHTTQPYIIGIWWLRLKRETASSSWIAWIFDRKISLSLKNR